MEKYLDPVYMSYSSYYFEIVILFIRLLLWTCIFLDFIGSSTFQF